MECSIASLNTWSGGHPLFLPYVTELFQTHSVLLFQEVHHALVPDLPTTMMPRDSGSRRYPVRPYLRREIEALGAPRFASFYDHHCVGVHDLEPDNRLLFGQLTCIDQSTYVVRCNYTSFVFGRAGQFNTESEGGSPCAKKAIAQVIRRSNVAGDLIVVNVHGHWSIGGKCDTPERFEQNKRISQMVEKLCRVMRCSQSTQLLIMGDLNYISEGSVLADLAEQPCFGPAGGVILNHQFGVTDTRTSFYEKPVREADFAIVNQTLHSRVLDVTVDKHAPSDHALLCVKVDL